MDDAIDAYRQRISGVVKSLDRETISMRCRDATPADIETIAAVSDVDAGAVRQWLLARTVRVAEDQGDCRGVICFDADDTTVHISRIAGDQQAHQHLISEPIGFAEREGLPIETVVPIAEDGVCENLQEQGFERVGDGPHFRGMPTVTYRHPGGLSETSEA